MVGDELRARAADAFARRRWLEAFETFAAADAAGQLPPGDLERLGLAALLTGRDAEADAARERAHLAHLRNGDVEAAARAAFWLALSLTLRGENARGNGWFARVQRVLDEAGLSDSVWRGFLLVPKGMAALFAGDIDTALAVSRQVVELADRFGDADLRVLAHHAHGQSLVATGDVAAGLAELDEVMVAVTTGDEVSPQVVGLVYCAVIEICRDSFDVRRAREWTDVLTRWCAAQPDLVPYRGQCLVHRSELLQLHGSWPEAMAEVERVCARLGEMPGDLAAGMAFYQRGELHRMRGENDEAEAAYRQAARVGHDPQPGLGLLRLAQGQLDLACAAVRRALDEAQRPTHRQRLLPAYVEIALAAGDVAAARQAADELTAAVGRVEVPLLTAVALQATGAVLLADGEPQPALGSLRRACSAWQNISAPYEAARSRVLVAQACRALGDEDSAEMELDAARWVFKQLGAAPDLARVANLSTVPGRTAAPGGLTLREVQVLRLVATGASNRAIATELFLSEKTVARHVANIFVKLDLSSRAAATAYAYEHGLV